MIQKNTPELWDSIWKPTSLEEEEFRIKKAECSIHWQRIEKIILKKFKTFKKLKTIEIGSGSGTNSLLFALRGADVTLLDFSKKALERAEKFFKRQNVKVKLVLQDALKLDKKLLGKFDVAMSFGLGEHFKRKDRTKIIKSHFDVLKKDGVTLICLPNRWNIPYTTWKFLSQITGRWRWGIEIPFSRKELIKITKSLDKGASFIGDDIFSSFDVLNPLKIIKRIFGVRRKLDLKEIKKQKGTSLDQYFSPYITLIGRNK